MLLAVVTALALVGKVESQTYYDSCSARIAETPFNTLTKDSTKERTKDAIVWFVNNKSGSQFMMDKMLNIAFCESSFNVKAYNPEDTDGLPAFGLFQFKERTFYYFAQKYKIVNPDIWSPQQQIELAYKMFGDGYIHLWGCR